MSTFNGKSPPLELCWGTVASASLPELIDVAAAAGFAFISATPVLLQQALSDGKSVTDLRCQLDDLGISVSYIDGLASVLPGATPSPVEAGGVDDFLRATEALRAPRISVVHFQGSPTPEGQLVDALGTFRSRATEEGTDVLVEFLPGTGIGDISTAARIVRAVGADRDSIVVDSLHLYRSGGSPDDLTEEILPLVGAIQLSDRAPEQDERAYQPMSTRLLPGAGFLPLGALLDRIIPARPTVPIGIEVFSEDLKARAPQRAAQLASESLARLLADRSA